MQEAMQVIYCVLLHDNWARSDIGGLAYDYDMTNDCRKGQLDSRWRISDYI